MAVEIKYISLRPTKTKKIILLCVIRYYQYVSVKQIKHKWPFWCVNGISPGVKVNRLWCCIEQFYAYVGISDTYYLVQESKSLWIIEIDD